ncbi:MAG: hypothetical protein HYZ71_17185, partial [Deltaproteobacteria bacterium]|nr:hypothetical protein [Deltaproteobacteria bacterium]
QNFGLHIATAIGINDGPKYEFGMTGSDLVGILRLGTGSGKIEIHTLTGNSGYQTFSVHAATDMTHQ